MECIATQKLQAKNFPKNELAEIFQTNVVLLFPMRFLVVVSRLPRYIPLKQRWLGENDEPIRPLFLASKKHGFTIRMIVTRGAGAAESGVVIADQRGMVPSHFTF